MTPGGPPDAPEGGEPGLRRIRLDMARGFSLVERLSHHLHRFTWRTPLHSFRLRGRYPLKLLGVPRDPLPGSAGAGRLILEGRIEHRGESIALDELDFAALSVSSALVDHLHSFAWLADLAAAAPREKVVPLAERLVSQWLAAHGTTVGETAWRPDLCARRLFYWTAYAPLILSSSDIIYRSAVLTGLARQARHLERTADKARRGLNRILAWSGVIMAGLLIPGGEDRVAAGEDGLRRAIETGMSSDGGLRDRSPLHQLELVEALSRLRAVYALRGLDLPEGPAGTLVRAVAALQAVLHGDGALSSWQGSGLLDATRVDEALAASGCRGAPLRVPGGWGYHRLAAQAACLIVDAAPPPALLGRGGCASTLAFEFSEGATRLVVNCGGPAGGLADFPAGLADALRATAAHSALVIDDTNSTATFPDGSLGRGVTEVVVERRTEASGETIVASHDGYVRRFGQLHRRTMTLAADGLQLDGEDRLLPEGRRWRTQPHRCAIRFHLAPDIEVTATADGHGALLRTAAGAPWQFRCREGQLSVEESLWVDESGWPRMTQQLVIMGDVPAGGATFAWNFRRAG